MHPLLRPPAAPHTESSRDVHLSLWLCGGCRVTGSWGREASFLSVSNFSELLSFSGNSFSSLAEGAAQGRPDRVREVPARAGRRPEGPGTALGSGPRARWGWRPRLEPLPASAWEGQSPSVVTISTSPAVQTGPVPPDSACRGEAGGRGAGRPGCGLQGAARPRATLNLNLGPPRVPVRTASRGLS